MVLVDELWDRARTEALPPAWREKAAAEDQRSFRNVVELVQELAAKVPDRESAEAQPQLFTDAEWMSHIELCAPSPCSAGTARPSGLHPRPLWRA